MTPVLTHLLLLLTTLSLANATPCNHDNCYRAISGSFRGPWQESLAYEDCLSYMNSYCSNEIVNITITQTYFTTITAVSTVGKRSLSGTQTSSGPFMLPSYASVCEGEERYSSACSCWGVRPETTSLETETYTTTTTSTITATLPTICPNNPALTQRDLETDALNCGACGNVCDSGVCIHGTCNSVPSCTPNTCTDGIQPCITTVIDPANTCYCFSTFVGLGFCGENLECEGATQCYDDNDCVYGEVCAWENCCGSPVCVLGNCPNPAASLLRLVRRNSASGGKVLVGDTAAYKAG